MCLHSWHSRHNCPCVLSVIAVYKMHRSSVYKGCFSTVGLKIPVKSKTSPPPLSRQNIYTRVDAGKCSTHTSRHTWTYVNHQNPTQTILWSTFIASSKNSLDSICLPSEAVQRMMKALSEGQLPVVEPRLMEPGFTVARSQCKTPSAYGRL